MRLKGFVRRLAKINLFRLSSDVTPQTLLTVASGTPISAKSELLSNASPVFEKLIKEGTKEINLKTYSPVIVKMLLTILAGERVDHEMALPHFREMHGLVTEYRIRTVHQNLLTWLQTRVKMGRAEFEQVVPLLQAVAYVSECDPDCSHLPELFLQTIELEPSSVTLIAVLREMLYNIEQWSQPEILLTLRLTDHITIARQLLPSLPEQGDLHENQTFLLSRLDLVSCLLQQEDLFEELFSRLLGNAELSDDNEIRLLRLQMECYKHYQVEDEEELCLTEYMEEWGRVEAEG